MKRILSFLPVLLLSAASLAAQTTPPSDLPSPQPGEPSGVLTLQEAVRVALEKNPAVQAANAYADAVEKGIAEARAAHLPQIGFSEGFTRSNNPVYVFGSLLTQRQFTAGDFALNTLNTPTPLDNFRTQFTASLPLFDAGQTTRRVRDARLNAAGAAQERQRTRQEVVYDVVKAYLNELLARENVRVAEASLAMTKADLARAQARQDQGLAVPSDLLSAKVQLAQAQQDLLQAQNAVALAQAGLDVAMGVPEDSAQPVEGTLSEITADAGTVAERQQRALTLRPDFLEADLGRQRAENGRRMARAEFLPTVNLFSSWEEDNQTFAARGGNNWMLGASLNFNVFDGGARRARVAAAAARQRQAEAQVARMAAGVRLQVREAYLNLDTARQRVEVSRAARSEAAESLRIVQNRYEAGLATITDLLRVETANTAAQKNYLNAVFDLRLSYAALELSTGELSANSSAVSH